MPLPLPHTHPTPNTFNIPLRGASPTTLDIYLSPLYAKINAPPFLTFIDFRAQITMQHSKAWIENGVVYIRVQWSDTQDAKEVDREDREREETEEQKEERIRKEMESGCIHGWTKEESMKRRERSQAMYAEYLANEQKQKKIGIQAAKDQQVRMQIKLEEDEREQSRQKVSEMKEAAISEIERQEILGRVEEEMKKRALAKKTIPPPRKGGTITVQFTPRTLRSAARETQDAEIAERMKELEMENNNAVAVS